jgi:lysosomal acid lipase/cholesteryl ester hydrolase
MNSDMMQWVFNTPKVAPALVLAKAGYDVWLGNNRGTKESDKHVTLKDTDKHFWNFTWEEMGTKDVPKIIDKISEVTNQSKISYIGHSEGATQILAGASLLPEFY